MSSATHSVFWVIKCSLVSLHSRPLWERHSRAGAPSGGENSLCAIIGHLQGPSGPACLQHPWPGLKTTASSCHPQPLSTHTMVSVSFNASCNMVYQALPYFIQNKIISTISNILPSQLLSFYFFCCTEPMCAWCPY